jgi:ABC-type transport system involved in cytochrome c biogenesis permease subunit
MMELISGLIGVAIGGAITYLFSIRILRKQSEAQQAYEFVSQNYLPLLSAIKQYKVNLRNVGGKKG